MSNPVEVYNALLIDNDLVPVEQDYDATLIDTGFVVYDFPNEITTSNGNVVQIPFFFTKPFTELFVLVVGNSEVISQNYRNNDQINRAVFSYIMPKKIIEAGSFKLQYWISDTVNNVSNIAETKVDVLKLGQGTLQVSFSWDSYGDLDLWVYEPSGEKIYFGHKKSATGGELDYDNTSGFGPENIYWATIAPEGQYSVYSHLYNASITEPINYTICVNFGEISKIYSGSVNHMNRLDSVTTFWIDENDIIFNN